jgi:hypothetical protein
VVTVGGVGRVEEYRTHLRALDTARWPQFLTTHSGLPGPRGNIELGRAVGEEADATTIDALVATGDEYLSSVASSGWAGCWRTGTRTPLCANVFGCMRATSGGGSVRPWRWRCNASATPTSGS